MRRILTLLVLSLAATVGRAQSTAAGDVSFAFQLGTNFPQSTLGNHSSTGFTTSFDVTYNLTNEFHLRTELGYSDNRLNLPANFFGVGGSHYNYNLTENAVYRFGGEDISFYVLGGLGAYRTTLALDQSVVVPGGGWWYGWWYPIYGTATLTSRTTTKVGYNAGGGVAFRLGGGISIFLESRYTQIQTEPTVDYVPLTVGIRF